jgi:hypothetical protein
MRAWLQTAVPSEMLEIRADIRPSGAEFAPFGSRDFAIFAPAELGHWQYPTTGNTRLTQILAGSSIRHPVRPWVVRLGGLVLLGGGKRVDGESRRNCNPVSLLEEASLDDVPFSPGGY